MASTTAKTRSVTLSDQTAARLDAEARRQGLTRSQVVERLVLAHLPRARAVSVERASCGVCGRYVTRGRTYCRDHVPTTLDKRRAVGRCVGCGEWPEPAGAELCAVCRRKLEKRKSAFIRRKGEQ